MYRHWKDEETMSRKLAKTKWMGIVNLKIKSHFVFSPCEITGSRYMG